jgi:hypothetical protein
MSKEVTYYIDKNRSNQDDLSEYEKLQAKYHQLQIERSIMLQREEDLLADSIEDKNKVEQGVIKKLIKSVNTKRKELIDADKSLNAQKRRKNKTNEEEKTKTAACKDTTIDWEIPPHPALKCDEVPLPMLDPHRQEIIVKILNHRKERNKTGELLIVFGSGENFWSSVTKVNQDAEELLGMYLFKNDLNFESMKKKRKVSEINCKGGKGTINSATEPSRNSSGEPDEVYECRENHATCLSFYAEGNSMYAAPNNQMHGKQCQKCKKQFVSSGTRNGNIVTPGKNQSQ